MANIDPKYLLYRIRLTFSYSPCFCVDIVDIETMRQPEGNLF